MKTKIKSYRKKKRIPLKDILADFDMKESVFDFDSYIESNKNTNFPNHYSQ